MRKMMEAATATVIGENVAFRFCDAARAALRVPLISLERVARMPRHAAALRDGKGAQQAHRKEKF